MTSHLSARRMNAFSLAKLQGQEVVLYLLWPRLLLFEAAALAVGD